ncbi:MAG: hypothetical protein QOJ79_1959 [Actinomycetota bacterium]|jgi:hypothetical protein|nr:hypothetical protein [Actinomycetota bacterium]
MRRTAITALTVIAPLALALSACGNDAPAKQPAVSSFAEGTCRVAAPDVLALGAAGQRLGTTRTVDGAVLTDLRDAQAELRTITDGAEPAYKNAFSKLVESTGFVRIRADGNSYDPALGRQLMADYNGVLSACAVRR